MNAAPSRHRVRSAGILRSTVVALAPLLLSGCSVPERTLSAIGIVLVVAALAGISGFAGGIAMTMHAYEHWERVVANEHRHEIRRLTESSTELATEAGRVISAARAALASLRSQLATLR